MNTLLTFLMSFLAIGSVSSAVVASVNPEFAIVDAKIATELKIPIEYQSTDLGLAVTKLNIDQKALLSKYMHDKKRCGGFELIQIPKAQLANAEPQKKFDYLFKNFPQKSVTPTRTDNFNLKFDQKIADLTEKVSAVRLKELVTWISSYETRFHADQNKNAHVNELKSRLEQLAKEKSDYVKIDLVSHSGTGQKTVRARIIGANKPNELIVLGAHFDSINQYGFLESAAPGADDDGSGSANLIEIFTLLLQAERPERTIEFMWYAAEEIGLVGSSEIAQSYKAENKEVISVLQLDMTLFPGSGELSITFMTDFTNPALTSYFEELNKLYVRAAVKKDRCGYGCSDHASWHRQGYAAVMPFESNFDTMNNNIHTKKDVVSPALSFNHSAGFSKLGLAYAMAAANSEVRF